MTDERLAGGIKTSGERRTFETSTHRDSNTKVLKGRMDLVYTPEFNTWDGQTSIHLRLVDFRRSDLQEFS